LAFELREELMGSLGKGEACCRLIVSLRVLIVAMFKDRPHTISVDDSRAFGDRRRPNLPEAEVLTGIYPGSEHRVRNAAMVLKMLGAASALFKGGHGEGDIVRDVLWNGDDFTSFEAPRIDTRHTHGTGCTLATAIACGLAEGRALPDAVECAIAFVQNAIRTAPQLGRGHGPLNHRT
jgi:hydroxymethylpyrimidine/phosphomethylpyrimidine kinase